MLWTLQEAWDPELGSKMRMNTRRYIALLSDAVEACLPEPDAEPAERDVFDVLQEQRSQNTDPDQVSGALAWLACMCCLALCEAAVASLEPCRATVLLSIPNFAEDGKLDVRRGHDAMCRLTAIAACGWWPQPNNNAQMPNELKRRFEVRLTLVHEDKSNYTALRKVRANHIGQLVTIRAMVARCSDVKPQAKVVTYTCEECGFETYQEVTGRTFMPIEKCKSPVCVQYNSNSKLLMQSRGSKFIKFQELKIQELPGQVPTGHIPRMMTVHLLGELTRSAAPGDEIELSGIFLPTPYTGYKAMKAGLTADTFLEATSVHRIKQRYQDYEFSADLEDEIAKQVLFLSMGRMW